MSLGDPDERLDDVVEERPAAHVRERLDVQEIVCDVGRSERHLHETLVPLREHLYQLQGRLVVHDVGDHGSTVIVALHRTGTVRVEALRRPPAASAVALRSRPVNDDAVLHADVELGHGVSSSLGLARGEYRIARFRPSRGRRLLAAPRWIPTAALRRPPRRTRRTDLRGEDA